MIDNRFMFWNARGVANAATQRILNRLIKAHKLSLVAVMEPLVTPRHEICRRLGLEFKMANSNNQIWILARREWNVECCLDTEQLLHLKITTSDTPVPFWISAVYGKCSGRRRQPLWRSMKEITGTMEGVPWLVGGDFNIFVKEQERRGATPCSRNKRKEMLDFADAISDCQLLDPGHDGAQFTWARGALFERLDRVLVGEGWPLTFPITRVTNLPRIGSDHGPLLIRCSEE